MEDMLTISESGSVSRRTHLTFYRKIGKDEQETFSNYIIMFIED